MNEEELKARIVELETRVQGLLEDNNRYQEEARAARRSLATAQAIDELLVEKVGLLQAVLDKAGQDVLATYQTRARETAVYVNIGQNYKYALMGLTEEVGEVAGQLKRVERDDGDIITPERREKIKLEMGDVFWYFASLASELDFTLNDIAAANLAKLADRKARKALHGSGDQR